MTRFVGEDIKSSAIDSVAGGGEAETASRSAAPVRSSALQESGVALRFWPVGEDVSRDASASVPFFRSLSAPRLFSAESAPESGSMGSAKGGSIVFSIFTAPFPGRGKLPRFPPNNVKATRGKTNGIDYGYETRCWGVYGSSRCKYHFLKREIQFHEEREKKK